MTFYDNCKIDKREYFFSRVIGKTRFKGYKNQVKKCPDQISNWKNHFLCKTCFLKIKENYLFEKEIKQQKTFISDKTKETLILICKYIGYALIVIGIIIIGALIFSLTKKKTKINTPRPQKRREYPY